MISSLESAVKHSIRVVYQAEQVLLDAKRVRASAITAWLQSLEGDAFWAALTTLYWDHEDIDVTMLGEATGITPTQISKHVGGHNSGIPCEECGEGIIVSSRSKLKEYMQVGGKMRPDRICDECRRVRDQERSNYWERVHAAQAQRFQDLRTMPYREYLATPEWQARRARMVRSAGYRCQLCNRSGKELHVHHRTYERRGCEWNRDLLVLCSDCHERFHEESAIE